MSRNMPGPSFKPPLIALACSAAVMILGFGACAMGPGNWLEGGGSQFGVFVFLAGALGFVLSILGFVIVGILKIIPKKNGESDS